MLVNKLVLKNYRNHINKEIFFEPQINIIVGNNGSGKTNILEAINLISTTKSLRARYDKELINFDHNFCTVNLLTNDDILEIQIIKSENINSTSKKVKINKTPKTLHSFCGYFNSVIFSPLDIEFITGSPSLRRKYIDLILSQTSNEYKKNLNLYVKAVRQRNKLLEMINSKKRSTVELEYWNDIIINLGEYIQLKRNDFFNFVQNKINFYNQNLNNNKHTIFVNYNINLINKQRILKYVDTEIYAKNTLIGPHRDDFEIIFDDKNIAYFGSRGQQRTAILALKLCEIDYIKNKKQQEPILLLDDIFSELDSEHRHTLIETIKKRQTIISATEIPNFLKGNVVRL